MQNQFQIVFNGKFLPGFTLEQIRENVAVRLRMNEANQEAIFSGRRAVLKRGLDFTTADTIREEYSKLGLKVHLEPERTVAAAARAALNDDLDILPPLAEDELAATPSPAPAPTQAPTPAPAPISIAKPSQPEPTKLAPPLPEEPATPSLTSPPAVAEMHCPKCNAAQPKRTLCRACGIDMPRYIAGQQEAERNARDERIATGSRKRPSAPRKAPRERRASLLKPDQAALFGFGFRGRFSRTRYLVSIFISVSVLCLSLLLSLKVGAPALGVGVLLVLFQALRSTALRLHDVGRNGFLALLLLIPLLDVLFVVALLFWPGNDYANDHGETPATEVLLLQLVSFLAMVILVAMLSTRMEQFNYLSAIDTDSTPHDTLGK